MHFFERAVRKVPFLSKYYYGWLYVLMGTTTSRSEDQQNENNEKAT